MGSHPLGTRFSILAFVFLGALACENIIATTHECGEDDPCESGAVCINGRCHGLCSSNEDCDPMCTVAGGDGEQCIDGICTPGCDNFVPDSCETVGCDEAPPSECADDATLRTYRAPGVCFDGSCVYPADLVTCGDRCFEDQCIGEPCAGVTCQSPPSNVCVNSDTLRVFDTTGTCSQGLCEYSSNDINCGGPCEAGFCSDDPCASMTCNSPPPNECVGTDAVLAYGSVGICASGSCNYTSSQINCPNGCSNGQCNIDPCHGVTCNTPPAPSCSNSVTLRTPNAHGTCNGGHCEYGHTETPCPRGCSNGVCGSDCVQPTDLCVPCAGDGDCAACEVCSGGFCALAAQGTTCRSATNLCDVAETCTGASPLCPIDSHLPACSVCESIRGLAGTSADAAPSLQACIDAMDEEGATLYLPPGTYNIGEQIVIASSRAHGLSLRTEGKELTDAKCALESHNCAELRATTGLWAEGGLLIMTKPGCTVDHIVVNGNRQARGNSSAADTCRAGNNSLGFNIRWVGCDNCVLQNSVSQNALCGTGQEVSRSHNIRIEENTYAYNGIHDSHMLWADGLTVHDAAGSRFTDNEFIDNTDIDLIFGGCQSCVIQGNVIWHTDDMTGGAFAALMIHKWPFTSGDYTGTDVSQNTVDCGPGNWCGIGLLIGSDPWYNEDVFGGSVRNNTISNVEQGVLIDDAHDMAIYNNSVTSTTQFTWTSQNALMRAHAYSMDTGSSYNIDTNGDPTTYTEASWGAGVIPNWWSHRPAPICDRDTQTWPAWGVSGGSCYPSCGSLGGTSCESGPCSGDQADVGSSYDCPYCCTDPICGDSICQADETCVNCPDDCGECAPSVLNAGESLAIGDRMNSPNGQYTLVLQEDGNLAVYFGIQGATWSSGTAGSGGAMLIMQSDGNLVLYTPGGTAVWHTSTGGPPTGKWLMLQDDGNLVIYAPPATAVWWSL